MAYEKFTPEITPQHRPFWDSVRRHEMHLQRCDGCGAFRFIPSERCPCGHPTSTWSAVTGVGELYTFTVVHRAPTPAYQAEVPYVIAHVTLAEGPRMISNLINCDPSSVEIGMPVRIVYEDVTDELTLYKFEPAVGGPRA